MEMIIHEDVAIEDDSIRFHPIIQQIRKQILILVIPEYCLPLATPAGYMV